MTKREPHRVEIVRRLHPRVTAGDEVEMFDLVFEGRVVVSRPTEAAARKAAQMYGWIVEDAARAAGDAARGEAG